MQLTQVAVKTRPQPRACRAKKTLVVVACSLAPDTDGNIGVNKDVVCCAGKY
jgi:hypothetical protein